MKKVLILVIILFIALYSSVFTVKDNMVAIVTNTYTKTNKMYTSGIYFALPFIQQVNYIEQKFGYLLDMVLTIAGIILVPEMIIFIHKH